MQARSPKLIVDPLGVGPEVPAAIRAFSERREPAILDTARPDRFSHFTALACEPALTLEIRPGDAVFDRLREALAIVPTPISEAVDLPFLGGWMGFLTYEAGLFSQGAAIPCRCHPRLPLARFSLYDSVAIHDLQEDRWHVAVVEWPPGVFPGRPAARERLQRVHDILREAADRTDAAPQFFRSNQPGARLSRDAYLGRFDRVQEYIGAGDVYQVNLTTRWTAETSADPTDLFLRLRATDPAPYSALLRWGSDAVISASPELFLDVKDRHAITRPIKGTRPRSADRLVDDSRRRDLAASPKDQAELTMIVDLLRNDLGRVSEYGSVHVAEAGEIEAHPTVFHRVASIESTIRSDLGPVDVLSATFPGGSVTGAPKVRAMQIIGELEPVPRGAYCGAIGWIGLDGSMKFNIAIRTIFQHGRAVEFHAGSGIVADSAGEDEYAEILAKTTGIRRALGTSSAMSPRCSRSQTLADIGAA